MARHARIDLPGVPQHVYARGNNRADCFFEDRDRHLYLRYLGEAACANRCSIHAYTLMTNPVHLLVTASEVGALSRMMRSVHHRYACYVNASRERTGALFEGRFRSNVVQTESYLFTCMRYVEMNCVRAGLRRAFPGAAQRRGTGSHPEAPGQRQGSRDTGIPAPDRGRTGSSATDFGAWVAVGKGSRDVNARGKGGGNVPGEMYLSPLVSPGEAGSPLGRGGRACRGGRGHRLRPREGRERA
jgi:REP element-mobilizing transposase RayT